MNFEKLYTLLTLVGAILKSWPITPLSSDLNDFIYLSSGHFLIGEPLTTILELDLMKVKVVSLPTYRILVLVQGSNLPPLKWMLDHVVAIHPREDKVVRVVSIKTKYSELKRVVSRLCVLSVDFI